MAERKLVTAKVAKKDEFYTRYEDIEKEVQAYLEYNPNVFLGKTILLPCDDPEWSDFTKYFAQNFENLGLKKLISTSYAINSKLYKGMYQPTLFETTSSEYDDFKTKNNGKIFTLTRDKNRDSKIDIDDLEWHYLNGDGDFRSDEIKKLRDEADFIITNPPFSLWREFFAWVTEASKHFLIIGNINAITYKETFPFIKDNKIWIGVTNFNTGMYFKVQSDFIYEKSYKFERERNGEKVNRVPSVCWITNIDHGRRHQALPLMTMDDNLRYSKHKEIKGRDKYIRYDNYDAIEVPFTDSIPNDYAGAMGVPITFLDKYNPEQFEILGLSRYYTETDGMSKEFVEAYYKSGQTGMISEGHPDLGYYDYDGKPVVPYMRVLIRHRNL